MDDNIWYNAKWLTALISLSTFILGAYITHRKYIRNERRTLLILITQTNLGLFSVIYQGTINPENINYINLRESIMKTNIIYLLPKRLKEPFEKLYQIHYGSPQYYDLHKSTIPSLLKDISKQMDSYGVEIFGDF